MSSLQETPSAAGGGGGGGSDGSAVVLVDLRDRKAKKKEKREERKEERKKKQKIAKLYSLEERTAYAKKKEAEARLVGSLKKKANIERIKNSLKEPTISYDKLTGPYTPHANVSILLELCAKYIVSTSTSEASVSAEASVGGGAASTTVVSKVRFSPKWIELLEMVKYILPPTTTFAYRKQLLKDGGSPKKVKRIREPSMCTWMSVQLFFALHKLTLKFIAKKPMKLKHIEGAARCITSINHMIKTYNDYSPRLQQFFNLLGVPPTIVISRTHIPVARAFIGIADRSPVDVSLFPIEKPFDGKLKEECGICFLLDSESATCLACKHTFHTECINIWFKTSKTCATCRKPC